MSSPDDLVYKVGVVGVRQLAGHLADPLWSVVVGVEHAQVVLGASYAGHPHHVEHPLCQPGDPTWRETPRDAIGLGA